MSTYVSIPKGNVTYTTKPSHKLPCAMIGMQDAVVSVFCILLYIYYITIVMWKLLSCTPNVAKWQH